eukprot:TRINITY_DN15965_c0_g1_i1.p1 TRINITY_DN15965_c0_g1~~TRINITY_DN15965_c0_g1_i1.p1  ORF type:complete len:628 (-),score=166.53 TRINITY_DN15965_c0_g1_i1:94-1977(-)
MSAELAVSPPQRPAVSPAERPMKAPIAAPSRVRGEATEALVRENARLRELVAQQQRQIAAMLTSVAAAPAADVAALPARAQTDSALAKPEPSLEAGQARQEQQHSSKPPAPTAGAELKSPQSLPQQPKALQKQQQQSQLHETQLSQQQRPQQRQEDEKDEQRQPDMDETLLMGILELAVRYRLCTGSQKQMMLDYVRKGRFEARYYIDMWTRRLESSRGEASVALGLLLADMPTLSMEASPTMAATQTQVVSPAAREPPAGAGAAASAAVGFGFADSLATTVKAETPCHAATPKRARLPPQALQAEPPCSTPSPKRARKALQAPLKIEPQADEEAAAATRAAAAAAAQLQLPPSQAAAAALATEDCWENAPQELMRRATRRLEASDQASHQADDVSGGDLSPGTQTELVELLGSEGFVLDRRTLAKLRPYQREGVAWMANLHATKSGGILADDMGLGKTVQACAMLSGLRRSGATHALVLVPVTLLDQWAQEARKWCPDWQVFTYYGTAAQRARALEELMLPTGGILLTSYAVMKNGDTALAQVQRRTGLVASLQGKRGDGAEAGIETGKRRAGRPAKRKQGSEPQQAESVDQRPRRTRAQKKGPQKADGPRPWDIVFCDAIQRRFR